MQDQIKDNNKRQAIAELLRSDGWKFLVDELAEELENIDFKAKSNMSEEISFACMQKRLGILYVINRAKDITNGLA